MNEWHKYLLGAAAMAVLFDDKAVYVMFYSLLGVFFIGEYLMKAVAGRLEVRAEVDRPRLNWGEEAVLTVSVFNPTRIPIPWMTVESGLPSFLSSDGVDGELTSIAGRSEVKVRFGITGRRRGVYDLRGVRVTIGDGITGKGIAAGPPVCGNIELLVYPRIWSVAGVRLPSRHPFGGTKASVKFFEDPARTMGIRDYMPGDSPRRVNWRISAKVGSLQVKEYEPTIALDSTIVVDLDPRDYQAASTEEYISMAIETASSFAHRLLTSSQTVGFVSNVGRDGAGNPQELILRPGKGVGHLVKVLDLMARVEAVPGVDFGKALHWGRANAQPGSTVIVVASGERSDVIDSCLVLHKTGYRVIFVVIGGVEKPEALGSLARQGVKVWQLFSNRDLERVAS